MKSRHEIKEEKKEVEEAYCRRCTRVRSAYNFYSATDQLLDKNGKMSICKDCMNDLYDIFYSETKDISRTILEMCRILNVKFDQEAVAAVEKQLATYREKGKDVHSIFGIYKAKLIAVLNSQIGDRSDADFTFYEPSPDVIEEINTIEEGKNLEYLQSMWGGGLNMADYEYLESEFNEWRRTTKCDTHPEEVLLKQICYIENDIRKKRLLGQSVGSDLKTLREMMKSGALTPAQQGSNSSNKSADSYGMWIKDIEKMTPAEYHEDLEKYKDMDGIDEDIDDIIRSIRNFMTDSRDFSTEQLEQLSEVIPGYDTDNFSSKGEEENK